MKKHSRKIVTKLKFGICVFSILCVGAFIAVAIEYGIGFYTGVGIVIGIIDAVCSGIGAYEDIKKENQSKEVYSMQTKYAVIQNIPDGNNEIVKMFLTEEEAYNYADEINSLLLDDDDYFLYVKEIKTITVPCGQTIEF